MPPTILAQKAMTPEQRAALELLDRQQAELEKLRNQLLGIAPKPEPQKPKTLREKIQEILTKESMNTTWIVRSLHMDKPKYREQVLKEIETLNHEGLIFNVGYADSPVWTWRIGDKTDNATLRNVVQRLISERPMYVTDIIRATGASEKRVSNELVHIQRNPPDGMHVVDMSPAHGYKPHGRAKMYFLATREVRDLTLQPSKSR